MKLNLSIMGNTQVKDLFANKDNLQTNSNSKYLEHFFHADLFSKARYFTELVKSNMDKVKNPTAFFDWSNIHQTSQTVDIVEDKLKQQGFKDKILVGNLPKNTEKELLNPTFLEECDLTYHPTNVIQFSQSQNQKFMLLYNLFYLMQRKKKKLVSYSYELL